jgi:hypothetical protein
LEKKRNVKSGQLKAFLQLLVFLYTLGWLHIDNSLIVLAEQEQRIILREREVVKSHWQLAKWSDGDLVCNLFIDHDQQPSIEDVLDKCGYDIYFSWVTTPSCQPAINGGNVSQCKGLFLSYEGTAVVLVEELVELPSPSVRVEIANCTPGGTCDARPKLNFIGNEPVLAYEITEIHVRIGESEKMCEEQSCELRMPITDVKGVWVEFWAVSDYGDESEHEFILLRNVEIGDSEIYRIDILGEGWDAYAPSGSTIWYLFPDLEHQLTSLLEQPFISGYLSTTNRYIYLAGNLINFGYADASDCPSGGLIAAAEEVLLWQNQYDDVIYQAALKYNIPARALKGIIAQETQFWPHSESKEELGLGKITENGADLLLTWNVEYYLSVCVPLFGQIGCAGGYANLYPAEQEMLRGTALSRVGTDQEIDVLAATLLASAAQINQLVENVTAKSAREVTTYEDMWSMTIGNYHSGAGCVGTAMQTAWDNNQSMDWETVTGYLLGGCQSASDYVVRVQELSK